jgi:hypothetical protein
MNGLDNALRSHPKTALMAGGTAQDYRLFLIPKALSSNLAPGHVAIR